MQTKFEVERSICSRDIASANNAWSALFLHVYIHTMEQSLSAQAAMQ